MHIVTPPADTTFEPTDFLPLVCPPREPVRELAPAVDSDFGVLA